MQSLLTMRFDPVDPRITSDGFNEVSWTTCAPPLPGKFIDLWFWRPAPTPSRLLRTLDPKEKARANRFRNKRVRTVFVSAHAGLRHILASYLNQAPETLRFTETGNGKPILENREDTPPLHFNLSHTKNAILLGVSQMTELGVDMEQTREDIRANPIAKRYFHPREQTAIEEADKNARVPLFHRFWTLKEAAIKAWGIGLQADFSSIDLSEATRADRGGPLHWSGHSWSWATWRSAPHCSASVVWKDR